MTMTGHHWRHGEWSPRTLSTHSPHQNRSRLTFRFFSLIVHGRETRHRAQQVNELSFILKNSSCGRSNTSWFIRLILDFRDGERGRAGKISHELNWLHFQFHLCTRVKSQYKPNDYPPIIDLSKRERNQSDRKYESAIDWFVFFLWIL